MQNDIGNLTPVKAGEKILGAITAARINSIQNLVRDMFYGKNVSVANGLTKAQNANGYTVAAAGTGTGSGTGSGSGSGSTKAFQIVKVTSTANGSTTTMLMVTPGTVGSVVPSNMFDTYSLSSGPFTLAVTLSDDFIGQPVSAVITRSAPGTDTKTLAYQQLGVVVGSTIYQGVSGSLSFAQARYDSIDEPEKEPLFANCFGTL